MYALHTHYCMNRTQSWATLCNIGWKSSFLRITFSCTRELNAVCILCSLLGLWQLHSQGTRSMPEAEAAPQLHPRGPSRKPSKSLCQDVGRVPQVRWTRRSLALSHQQLVGHPQSEVPGKLRKAGSTKQPQEGMELAVEVCCPSTAGARTATCREASPWDPSQRVWWVAAPLAFFWRALYGDNNRHNWGGGIALMTVSSLTQCKEGGTDTPPLQNEQNSLLTPSFSYQDPSQVFLHKSQASSLYCLSQIALWLY